MTAYSTILFDLDGTLTDPKVGITKSVQYALSRLGIDAPDLDALTPFIGPPLHIAFQQQYHFNFTQTQLAVQYYREYFSVHGIYENVLYQGIPQLLTSLKENSRNLIVATSKPTAFAQQILCHFGIDQFFDQVVGSNLDGTRSAKTEIVACALRQYPQLPSTDFVMVGDREHDIIGATSNGIDSIGVGYGYGSREELSRANATYIADTVEHLRKLL
ncbi:MAG: phosphoglycolate phosphatase [Sulfobacillus benefaciens]|uniref:Phosphoglycolate phosphatase n=1 Tax=Sulfobacillus benefaciens TaxID=453960 RepID=A0A2T2X7R3_9FIRM|nr:MAG: phosphoglycolate phosphatase [Sulfobacillus benefaciens]